MLYDGSAGAFMQLVIRWLVIVKTMVRIIFLLIFEWETFLRWIEGALYLLGHNHSMHDEVDTPVLM